MGVVRVRLHGASGLKPMDDTTRDGVLDLSDPYCTLHLHETEHRGATCRKTLNPTWEEEFEFRGTEDDSRGLLADVSGWQGPARGGERLTLGELLELPLELKVFDENRFMGQDALAP